MNYHGKTFKVVTSSNNSEVSSEFKFYYQQQGNIVSCDYSGGNILKGNLLGLVDSSGNINMRYHQITQDHKLMTGICHSTPEILPSGKIRLFENWQWTSGDYSKGESILEEI